MNESKIKKPVSKGVAKVPVVIQLEELECGAACLTMILGYYQKWLPLEKIRQDCGVSRDGTKASTIVKAARAYGLTARGYRYELEELMEYATFPCIIHWNFDHFVVLDGFRKGKAIINDPARGKIQVALDEFSRSFTGICLVFEPGETFTAEGKPKNFLDFSRKRLKGTRPALLITAITTLIVSMISVISPAFQRIFLDRLLTGKNPDWVVPFFVFAVLFLVIQFAASVLQSVSLLRIGGKFDAVGNSQYLWKILHLPMNFFSQRSAGDLMQRQQTNSAISTQFVQTVAPLFFDAVLMIFYLVVMMRYSVVLSFIGIFSIVVNVITANIISRKRRNITRLQMKDEGKLASATVSGIEMIETIKSCGAENGYFKRWSGYQASANAQNVQYENINYYLGMIPTIVSGIADIIVLIFGVWLVINGRFTIGMVMAFQGYLASFTRPAGTLISAGQTLQEMQTQMERIEDVMEYPEDPVFSSFQTEKTDNYQKLTGKIEVKHVTFGYSRLENALIEDFNLTLEPGKSIALVGTSGCGKSTIAKLLSGLYQPWSGEILFDGKPMSEINRDVFTGSVAVVDQDIVLFEDTIANNIRMWDSSVEDFEMILAARDAQIHEDIMQREGGYQYRMLEGGKDFSGGQRQRLEIARVLAQDSTILIMDEATSALDAVTEYEVVNAIRDRGISSIVIAHRLSTIRDCDEIIVLAHGRVVERGTHEELYQQNGVYKDLISNA